VDDPDELNKTLNHSFEISDDEMSDSPILREENSVSVCARSVLVAESPDYILVSADFQQMELRLLAHLSQDRALLDCFRNNSDVFEMLATKWMGVSVPSRDDRDRTKRLVYASLYGAGIEKLSQILRITKDEASVALKSFSSLIPGIGSYRRKVLDQCRSQGYLQTIFKRRRYFPNINSSNFKLKSYAQRQAINFVIQGSAADICKAAQVKTESQLGKFIDPTSQSLEKETAGLKSDQRKKVGLILHIHDELVWQIPRDRATQFVEQILLPLEDGSKLCEGLIRAPLAVSLPLSVKIGGSWGDMKTLERNP